MDAISFVLGIKAKQLRGAQLKELVHNPADSQSLDTRPRRAMVKLVYEAGKGEEVHFSRIIAPSTASADTTYQSHYKLDDKTVSWDSYNQKLESFGILVKAKNFLVFQVGGSIIPTILCV